MASRTLKKVGIGLGVAAVLLGYFYFRVAAADRANTRYCQQFLTVMDETHDLSVAPTPEQLQRIRDALNGFASLSHGVTSASVTATDAAAALLRDINAASNSQSGSDILKVASDADALTAACRADTG